MQFIWRTETMYCGLYETFTVFNRLPLCENRNVPYRETVRGRKSALAISGLYALDGCLINRFSIVQFSGNCPSSHKLNNKLKNHLGPIKRSPLKCIMCSGKSTTQTSVSHAIFVECLLNSEKSGNAET